MTETDDALVSQIKAVNKGRGVRHPVVDAGPALRQALRLEPDAGPEDVRRNVIAAWRRAADGMPHDLGLVLLIGSAITYGHPDISGRIQHAAGLLHVTPRTVWRYYASAVVHLANSLRRESGWPDAAPEDRGFYVIDFTHIADFSDTQPTFTGHRRIRVTAPHLSIISDTIGFPRLQPGQRPEYRTLSGCEIDSVNDDFAGTWSYRLRLPRTLHAGDSWDFSISVRIPGGSIVDPLAVILGTRSTKTARVEAWFGRPSVASRAWVLPGVPAFALTDPRPKPPLLIPDRSGKVGQSFRDLQPGRAYGLRWEWLPGEA